MPLLKAKIFEKYLALLFILLLTTFLQALFFIGYTIHPSDESTILRNSYLVLKNEFLSLLKQYRNVPKDGLYEPYEAFRFRPLMLLPIALFWSLFGINDITTVLWPMLCFYGTIIVTYFLGRKLFNHKVGIIAAFLISIFPLHLVYSTRVSIDTPLVFFMGLSVLFFLKGEDELNKKKSEIYFFFFLVFSCFLLIL